MTRYLVLLRGINVGGRNKVPMAALRELLESHGHTKVATYIASGNVILSADQSAAAIKHELEEALPKTFKLDSELIAVLVLTRAQLRAVVRDRPKGFGDKPATSSSRSAAAHRSHQCHPSRRSGWARNHAAWTSNRWTTSTSAKSRRG